MVMCIAIELSTKTVRAGEALAAAAHFRDPDGRDGWRFEWAVDGVPLQDTTSRIEIDTSELPPGDHTITARVVYSDTEAVPCNAATFTVSLDE
jgi:hypothetical protein